jgi:hypothetical protein
MVLEKLCEVDQLAMRDGVSGLGVGERGFVGAVEFRKVVW